MNKKRLISILLITATLAAVSCGDTGTPEVTTGNSETTLAPEETTAPSEYQTPGVRYDGQTVTIASYSYSGSSIIMNYNILLDEENGDKINDSIVDRNRKVEDELGVDLELFVLDANDRGSSAKLRQSILAGDNAFDFAMPMNASLAPMLTTEGMLVDLNTVKTLDLSKSWWNQNANEEYTLFGKQLAAVGDICFFNIAAPIVNYFSKDMIEKYKLDDPYQLVYDGKWTLDRMMKMATDVAEDLNGNQTVEDADQFGFAAEVDSLGYFLIGAGVRLSQHDKDGNITITLNNEKTVDIVDKLVPFFYTANVTRLQAKTEKTYSSVHTDYFQPKLGANELLFYSNQLLVALNMRVNESDFGVLPMAKYDDAQENYVSFANTWWSDHLIIPATCEDLDRAGHIIEAMGYYAQQLIVPSFIDTTVLGKSVRDEDSANMIKLIRETQTFDIAYIFDWGGIKTMLSNLANSGSSSFASEYASKENSIKSALESTLEALKN